jgi:protein phosphatase
MPNPTPPALHIGHLSDRGQRREVNEDHYWIPTPEVDPAALASKGMLFLVADGMGGHQGGQRASHLAASIVPQAYYGAAGGDAAQSLRQALQAANDEIVREARANAALHNMGTTAVAAVIQGNRLTVAHVGDSRAYRLRGGQLSQLTSDHSFVEEGISRGQIAQEDAATHPYRGVITRALGAKPELQPDVRELDWLPGDQLLLCTDGLSNLVPPEEIAAVLGSRGAQQAAQRLVDLANQNGGPDNITAVVVSYGGAASVARSPLPLVLGGVATLAVALLAAILIFLPGSNGPAEPTTVAQAPAVVDSVATAGGEPAGGQEAGPTATASASEESSEGAVDAGSAPTGAPAEEAAATGAPTTVAAAAPPVAATPPPGTPTAIPPTATPLPPAALTQPNLLAPNDGDTAEEQVQFRWVPVPNAAGYQVETRSERQGQTEWRIWDRLPGDTTSFRLDFVSHSGYFEIPGTDYYWRVAALDVVGRPVYSAVRRFVLQRAQAAMPTPQPTDTPMPTPTPTQEPTPTPTQEPTPTPTPQPPTPTPTQEPTPTPTQEPTPTPTQVPTPTPTAVP